jgi:threonine synthase
MRYISTRGEAAPRDFAGVLLAGLAEDGGLFVPAVWPELNAADWRDMRGLPYHALAARIVGLFSDGAIERAALEEMCARAYAGFAHPAVAPMVQLEAGLWSLELFHGPTLAFKDMAMQLLGQLFEHVLARDGRRVTIVGATSGDTGSAAIEACRDRRGIEMVILHPLGRTSEVQRRQMTTVLSGNIANLAVEGTFDDCQALVKAMFADAPFRDEMALSGVNSINWARIAAQVPYYVWAALQLGAPDRSVSFAVPTGNFGNVLAAWVARRMGLPVETLVIGSNRNDILARWVAGNDMSVTGVEPSLSPSMDIQVSSNFERLLFELLGRDPVALSEAMAGFRATGRMAVPDAAWRQATGLFRGLALDDAGTLAGMRGLRDASGYMADPHSAIGIAAGRAYAQAGVPMVAVATAHPAKFPEACQRAYGVAAELPSHLSDLFERPERFDVVRNGLDAVETRVRAHVLRNAA